MADFVEYFYGGERQALTLIGCAVVWLGLSLIGRIVLPNTEHRPYAPIVGWGIVVLIFTTLGTLSLAPFTSIAIGLVFLAIIGAIVSRQHSFLPFDPLWLRMVAIMAPLVLLAAAMHGSQWDEFSHWLTGQKYLLRHDLFPGEGRPSSSASFPGYPYAWQLLSYLASRVVGVHLEAASGVFNVLLLLTLARIAIDLAKQGCPKLGDLSGINHWVLAGFGAMLVTVLNPTFVQKIILTAYADTSTAVTLAIGIILGLQAIERTRSDTVASSLRLLVAGGLVFAILVSLKQSTLELFLLGIIALALFAVISGERNIGRIVATIGVIAAPAIATFMIWRLYVTTNLPGKEFGFLPYESWNIDLIRTILTMMLYVLLKKSAYFAAMLIAVGMGVRALFVPTFYGRTMMVVGLIFLGHVSFLFLCYVAVFGGHEARTIASFWRYNQQLGGLAIIVVAMTGGHFLVWLSGHIQLQRAAWLPVIIVLVAPLAMAHKLRFDKLPAYSHYRDVGRTLTEHLPSGSKLFVIDPVGTGESAIIARFELSELEVNVTYNAVFHDMSVKGISNFLASGQDHPLLVHSVTDSLNQAIGMSLEPRKSYLIKPDASGNKMIAIDWPWPADMSQ